jgi:hypothetical protein
MRRGIALFLAILFCALARPASASVQVAVLFDDLVRDSNAVCVFTGLEQKTAWEDGRIFTRTRVRCDQSFAGELKQGQEAWIRTMGGVVGDIGQSVSGEASLGVGSAAIVFVHAGPLGVYEVTARGQGHFPVPAVAADKPKKAVRGPDVGAVLAAQPAAEARVRSLARGALTASATQPALVVIPGKTTDEIANEVALAWRRTHP